MRLALLVAALAVLLLAMCSATPALAQSGQHGQGHAEHHDWYKDLINPNLPGVSCCNNQDCRPTRAYRDDDGTWWAQINGYYKRVPADRVLPMTAPDGGSHVCATEDGRIMCFVGGVPKS